MKGFVTAHDNWLQLDMLYPIGTEVVSILPFPLAFSEKPDYI